MYRTLQAGRGVAALLVVLHHLGAALGSGKYFGASQLAAWFDSGDAGVDFFFVLSGFIVTWVHFDDLGEPQRLGRYLRKRAARIYPVYWIVFAGVSLAAQVSPALRTALPHDFAALLKSLALLAQDPSVAGGTGAPVIIVAWSLQYEIAFYALIAAFIANRWAGAAIAALLLVNWGACRYGVCSFPRSFFSSNLVLLFGLGAGVACLCKKQIHIFRPRSIAALAGAAILLFAVLETCLGRDRVPLDRRLVYGCLSALLILALVRAEDEGRFHLRNRWLALLGDSSYCLYLIHYPLISLLCKLLLAAGLAGAGGAIIAFPLILGACVGASAAFHLALEKPMLAAFSRRPASRGRAAVST